jgi:CRISPR-associated endonuclease/helicase Cas3
MHHSDLWAKTDKDKTKKGNFHPVICHLLDTAAVCQQLIKLLPPATVNRLEKGLQLDRSGLLAWVPFLAGTHDTGKVSPPFQFQDSDVSELARQLAGGSLYDLWFKRPQQVIGKDPLHGTITACTLPEYLKSWMIPDLADELAAVVGGHHGIFPRHEEVQEIIGSSRKRLFHIGDSDKTPQWRQWRKEILDVLADFCQIANTEPPKICDPAAAVILAGITTLSDWFASDQAYFPPAGAKPDLDEYMKGLSLKAEKSLTAAQWQKWQPHEQPLNFAELFNNEPRGLQTAIETLMPEIQGKPTLLIIEAPTGEGKTEAALTVAHWNTSADMPGSYIGMPTQATGNALYRRLKEYLNNWYPNQTINYQLAHSASTLNDDFNKSICRLSNIYDRDKQPGGVSASEWFVSRKRTLLAPWGVGTIDRALMGILRKKHQFLYLLGLAGKTVILDEVHAYDGYTSQLLEQLVHWCAILGSPVVILSATLNSKQRQNLLDAYATGLSLQKPVLPVAEYPRLTIFPHQDKAIVSPLFTRDQLSDINRSKEIEIRWIDEAEIDVLIGKGPTAIIRSTVKRCQTTADRYKDATVFHSRFTQEHRLERETSCLETYGEPDSNNEPIRPPSLLVATQVIEQSLNVDFDVLISDLCPIDLLIQRLGRLWRFDIKNRCVTHRIIYLIKPKISESGLPEFGDDVQGRKVKNHYRPGVYDRHSLLRTYYLLRKYVSDKKPITLPNDTDDLIEQVYNLENKPVTELTEAQNQDWSSSLQDYQIWQESIKLKAKEVIIPDFKNYTHAENLTNRKIGDDKQAELVTRLIDNSMRFILDIGDGKVIKDRIPKGDEIRQILLQQVQISSLGLIYTLESSPSEVFIPKYWKQAPYLRDLPVLDLSKTVKVGDYSITYDPRLGLIATRFN